MSRVFNVRTSDTIYGFHIDRNDYAKDTGCLCLEDVGNYQTWSQELKSIYNDGVCALVDLTLNKGFLSFDMEIRKENSSIRDDVLAFFNVQTGRLGNGSNNHPLEDFPRFELVSKAKGYREEKGKRENLDQDELDMILKVIRVS